MAAAKTLMELCPTIAGPARSGECLQWFDSLEDRMDMHKNARLTPRERIVKLAASGQTPPLQRNPCRVTRATSRAAAVASRHTVDALLPLRRHHRMRLSLSRSGLRRSPPILELDRPFHCRLELSRASRMCGGLFASNRIRPGGTTGFSDTLNTRQVDTKTPWRRFGIRPRIERCHNGSWPLAFRSLAAWRRPVWKLGNS